MIVLVKRELSSHLVSLHTELAPSLRTILGDRVQLQQVIINLLMNGIEAMLPITDRPRVMVIRSSRDETSRAVVSVTDCGVGISAENADRLFNAFTGAFMLVAGTAFATRVSSADAPVAQAEQQQT